MVSQKEKVRTRMATPNAAPAETPVHPDVEKPFKQLVREEYAAGKTRAEIAKEHGVTYQRIFAITKGMANENTSARPRAVLEDGTLRTDKIRQLFDEGMTVGEISKSLNVSYQVVYQATKKQRAALKEGEQPESDAPETEIDEAEDDDELELEDDEESEDEDEE